MSGAIGPGDWVEFFDESVHHPDESDYRLLTVGGIYRVAAIVPSCEYAAPLDTEDGLELVEFRSILEGEVWPPSWGVSRFRPIYRPKSEIIQSLLQPAPELEPA